MSFKITYAEKLKIYLKIGENQMEITIEKLRKTDFEKAREFAIEGMHLHWYASSKVELYFYSKYFWYLEVSKATVALGAYVEDRLVGVLLADIQNEPKAYSSFWHRLYVKTINMFINIGYKEASNTYDRANEEMLEALKKTSHLDGEINFFAVDPSIKGKGIGTLLLEELQKLQKGKNIYLYTDSGSTYQFYQSRGFKMFAQKKIILNMRDQNRDLECFLFSKML